MAEQGAFLGAARYTRHCHAHDLGGWARLLREAWAAEEDH